MKALRFLMGWVIGFGLTYIILNLLIDWANTWR